MTESRFIDYKKDSAIAVDIETKDPELRKKGSGVYRKDGFIVGVSISNGEMDTYIPLRHKETTSEEREKGLRYLKDQLSYSNNKIFANGIYDLDWLIHFEGIQVSGKYDDVQIAEPLLNEYKRSYSLESLSQSYLLTGKKEDGLLEYCRQREWTLNSSVSSKSHIWKMPCDIVAPYAKEDARLTYAVFQKQVPKLLEQGLIEIYNLEMELYPLLLQMRKQGVRLDTKKLSQVGIQLSDLNYTLQKELNKIAGFDLNPKSNKQLEEVFKKHGLPITYGEPTELMKLRGKTKGNPRFDKSTLNMYDNPLATKILEVRHISTLLNLFIIPYPELIVDGRLHCSFNQLRSDDYGTVSGRFSSSNPNLQQVSGKEEEGYEGTLLNGKIIRKLFIPEEDHKWLKFDWSQIEYRLIAHYAMGPGAETIRKRYNEDPKTDYHEEMGKMSGINDRKIVKTLNFGAAYGMGPKKMASAYGWDLDEALSVYKNYHERVPFIKQTSNRVSKKAVRTGFIRTVLGRKARIKSRDKAYVMFNRLIQGGAADLMKKAMVEAYKSGVYNILKPHITVHDELDQSMPNTSEGRDAGMELKRIMENCVQLRVPIIADMEVGPNWGELEEVEDLI